MTRWSAVSSTVLLLASSWCILQLTPSVAASSDGRGAIKVASLLWSPVSHALPVDDHADADAVKSSNRPRIFQLPVGQHELPAKRIEAYLHACSMKAILIVERPESADTPAAEESTLPLGHALKHRVSTEGDEIRVAQQDVERYVRRACHASVMTLENDDDKIADGNGLDADKEVPMLIKLALPRLPPAGSAARADAIQYQAQQVDRVVQLMESAVQQNYLVLLTGSSHTTSALDDFFTSGLLMGLMVSILLVGILMVGIAWLTALQGAVPIAPVKQKKA